MKYKYKIIIYFSLILAVFLLPLGFYKDKITVLKNPNNEPVISVEKQEENLEFFVDKYNNSDIVARVEIEGTSINEPVAQTSDNDYYLNHDLYKNKDNKGSTFLDYRVNSLSRKKLIYGHNSSTLSVPFKELEEYYDYEYYKKHQFIKLEIDGMIQNYQIFSVFIETSDWSYMKLNYNEEEWLKHISSLKDNSFYDTGIQLNKDDEILILQTCSHHKDYKKYSKKYLLVIAKRIV